MILHHYDMSPFSEKIRLMLGYCNMEWQSLVAPAMPPRANVDPLAGGYRRMPVAQIGADIFCDTAIISEEIATLASKPQLALSNSDDSIKDFVSDTDLNVFFAFARQLSGLEAGSMLFRSLSPWEVVKFIKDRVVMNKTATVKFPDRNAGKEIINNFFNKLEYKLSQQRFLFSDEPGIADFSAYHPLWFRCSGDGHRPFRHWRNINNWFDAMDSFGHGIRVEITPQMAFDAAKNTAPRPLPKVKKSELKRGCKVSIGPADYAKDQVRGTLEASTDSRWIISRSCEEFGTLHVHFPKNGFELKVL